MKRWEPKGIGEIVEMAGLAGPRPRGAVVTVYREFAGVIRYPIRDDGPISFGLLPVEDCAAVGSAAPLSLERVYELLFSREHDGHDLDVASWLAASLFAGLRTSRYTRRLLAFAHALLSAAEFTPDKMMRMEPASIWGASLAEMLLPHITDDLAALSPDDRAALDTAAPWLAPLADRLQSALPPCPLQIDPFVVEEPWEACSTALQKRTSRLMDYVKGMEDVPAKHAALKALWPSVAEFMREGAAAAARPLPVTGDVFMTRGHEVCVIDNPTWAKAFPNQLIISMLDCPTISMAMLFCQLEPDAPVRRATREEWGNVLFGSCDDPDANWQIPHIVEFLSTDPETPPEELALHLLAYGRLYCDASSRLKRIGKSLVQALKSCPDDHRNWICNAYPEAAALYRTRAKPEAVAWSDDWRTALAEAIHWEWVVEGDEFDPKERVPRKKAAAAAPPAPGRMNPKLQGSGQVAARAKAAPAGLAHRVLEAEWDVRADAMAELVDLTFRWLEDKLGIALTDQWRTGYHEFDHHGFRLETEQMTGLFAFRIEHPDGSTPGRRWRVEGALIEPTTPDGSGAAAIRLIAVDQFKTMGAPPYSMPGIAQRWLASGALSIMKRDPREVWGVEANQDFFMFRNTAGDAQRPVGFVVTAGVCPDITAQLVGTIVHVHLAPDTEAAYAKQYGSLPGPGQAHLFAAQAVEPVALPFTTREEMEAAVRGATRVARLPSFGDIRQQVRAAQHERDTRARDKAGAAGTQSPAPSMPVAKAEQDTAQLMDLALADLDRANEAVAKLERRASAQDDELRQAQHQIRALKLRLGEDVGADDAAGTGGPLPDDFAQLEDFARRLEPRLVIAPKAMRAAQDAEDFQDKPLVFRALDALATHYWEMRFGDRDSGRARWQEFLIENRLTFGPVGHALDNQRFSDAYKAVVDRETLPLDLHLAGSSSRNPTKCLRVYLHADERRQRIVVGHLPSHLPNTHT